MTSLAMAQNPKPPSPWESGWHVPHPDSIVLWVEGTNLTVYIDSTSNPDDGHKLTTLEIKWTGNGGFNEQGCDFNEIYNGDFDVCRADKIAKVSTRGFGPIYNLGEVIPEGWDACRIVEEAGWIVDGSYLTGGTWDKFNPDSPYINCIPEPSALTLLMLGVLGLMAARRRK
jgi:hypothetical protein